MNKLFYLIIIFILTIFFSCSKKNNSPKPDSINIDKLETEIINDDSTDVIIELITNESENSINKDTSIVNESTMINDSLMFEEKPQFFQLEKSIEDILIKISFLEKQLLLKDSAPLSINYTNELKNLIDGPRIKHQISLKNESIIEGFIEEDTEENILIMTSLGKLRIDKDEIAYIEEIKALEPDIIFIGHGLEKQFENYYEFSGKLLNQGTLRGDFVRVVYKLWADDTNILFADSTFIEGDQIKYKSGIVTDTALNPNKSARYALKISTNGNVPVAYITREIHWIKYN